MCSQDVSAQKRKKKKSPPQAAFKNVLADAEWNGKKKKKEEMPTSYTNEGDFNSWLSLCVKISSLIVGCHYKVTDPGTPYF